MSAEKSIRVLIAAPKYIIGGHNQQALDLIGHLRRDFGVDAELQPVDPRLPGPFGWIYRVPVLRTVVRLIHYTLALLIRVPRYDIVHAYSAAHTSYVFATLPALFVTRLYGRRFILFYADGRIQEHLASWRTAAPTMKMATVMVGASPLVRDAVKPRGIEARVIPNAVNTRVHYRRRSRLTGRFLTNRLLEPLYNHPCIFRAVCRVQEKYPGVELVVGNEGFLRAELEQKAAAMGLRNYRFIGVRPIEEVPAIYDAADVYLTSPNVDCNPASIMECFAAGIPVIATRAGGIPAMVDDGRTGFLVDIDDDRAMAERMIELLENPELVERITDAARAEAARYQWSEVAAAWNRLYRELTAPAPPKP